jgi:prepilin-type processing-associated H-X9-DG protein
VMAGLLVLALLLLPPLQRHEGRAQRISCVNNLKQIGLGFRTWALDHNDLNPPLVSITNGGTLEFVGRSTAFRHLEVMSNELSTPRVLSCPDEKSGQRVTATTFSGLVYPVSPNVPFTGNSNLSYFVGVDASEKYPHALLTGDRQIGLRGAGLSPGLHSISTNSALQWVSSPHGKVGNIGLADGSVQQASSSDLQQINNRTGLATNRLDIP